MEDSYSEFAVKDNEDKHDDQNEEESSLDSPNYN